MGNRLYHSVGMQSAVGTFYKNTKKQMRYFDSVRMNLNDIIGVSDNFSHAVILLGDTQPNSCITDIAKSNAVNVESLIRIIDVLIEKDITPVFISSQFVFDGAAGEYVEEDAVNPILVYGRQKVHIEEYLEKHSEKYLVLRLANVYGDSPGDGTLFTSWMDKVFGGATQITCASDQKFSPIYIEDVVEAIIATTNNDCIGTYHVAGPQRYARVELLMMLLSKLEKYIELDIAVNTCSINDFDLPERRPIDVSMKPEKLVRDTGIRLNEPSEICDQMIHDYLVQR